jgi:circadian clock protein KaiB
MKAKAGSLTAGSSKIKPTQKARSENHILRLYVAAQTPKSMMAFANLTKTCEEHPARRYKIKVIDLLKDPHLAVHNQILAVPTMLRELPLPMRRVIGDLSNTRRDLIALDLLPRK